VEIELGGRGGGDHRKKWGRDRADPLVGGRENLIKKATYLETKEGNGGKSAQPQKLTKTGREEAYFAENVEVQTKAPSQKVAFRRLSLRPPPRVLGHLPSKMTAQMWVDLFG